MCLFFRVLIQKCRMIQCFWTMSRRDPSGNMLEIVCSNLHLHLIAYAFEGERITHLSHDYDTIFTFTFHDMATLIFCSPNYRDAHSSCPTRICCIKWRLLGKTLVHRYLSDWIEITSKLFAVSIRQSKTYYCSTNFESPSDCWQSN